MCNSTYKLHDRIERISTGEVSHYGGEIDDSIFTTEGQIFPSDDIRPCTEAYKELLQKISELEEELKVCGETHVEMVYEASLLREEVESLKSQLKAE